MPLPSSISTGKKSNSQLTLAENKEFNQAAQDNAIALVLDSSPGARVEFTDGGAFETVERVSADSFNVVEAALETINGLSETFAQQGENISRAGLATGNIRSQLPSEVIAQDNSELFRVASLGAAGVAIFWILFVKGGVS